MQRNWIGKSTGAEIEFSTESGAKFKVFTTRADTLSGVSFIVMAPEHPLVKELTTDNKKEAVEKYIDDTSKSNEIERLSTVREKTGVFIGAYAINPLNGKKIPIWISDYVLLTYGTGIVMGVPGGDERDYAFAKKFDLPITRVTAGKPGEDELPYHGDGILVNSGEFDGLTVEEGQKAIVSKLAKDGIAEFKTNYRLRDWLVSRQRYWGAPIPIIHCPHCGEVAVPYEDLPVKLPYDVEFKPDGKSPLAKHEGFMHTKCPKCGADALRDPDTLDTFVCSSWYYLRYPDAKDSKMPFDPEIINKMLPVDKYVGGAEHACMHLLYSRFITKALRDMGYLKFDEPFKSLVHQGVILGPDGARMSKSRGNVISPDPYVEKYGSDVLRLYLLFGFSYREGGPWDDNGIKAITKFYDRVERLSQKVISLHTNKNDKIDAAEKDLLYTRNYTVRCMTRDIEDFSFNTATARLMEYLNALNKYDTADGEKNIKLFKECFSDFILLLAPFAPHFSEEIWEQLGNKKSVFLSSYPEVEEKWLIKSENEVAVQVNSKIKTKIMLPAEATEDEIKELLLNNEALKPFISGKEIKKLIIIPKRLINIIV